MRCALACGSTSAVVTCVVDDRVTKIGQGPASCLRGIRSRYLPLWLCSRTISKSGSRRFARVQPHMPCTNSSTAHGPRMLFGKFSPLALRSNCAMRVVISPSKLKFKSSCNRPVLRVSEVGSCCRTKALHASCAPAFTTRVRAVPSHTSSPACSTVFGLRQRRVECWSS